MRINLNIMERQYSTMDSSLLLNMIFYMIAGKDILSFLGYHTY
jgi:hypothetical protein